MRHLFIRIVSVVLPLSSQLSNMAPPSKKSKLSVSSSTSLSEESLSYYDNLKKDREETAKSVLEFSFNKKRVRILSKNEDVKENSKGIVYWMSRDARVQDNWAFLFAQKLALKNEVPLYICFCLVPKFLDATIRHYKFMLDGLEEVQQDCKELNINFYLLPGEAGERIPKFVKEHSIGAVVCDHSPLRVPQKWVENVKMSLPADVPLCQVDAHNIVPLWVASDKQEYAARTIRNKINNNLGLYLTKFPPVTKHPHKPEIKAEKINWKKCAEELEVDRKVDSVEWATPGYRGGIQTLQEFCTKRLKDYNSKRNDPTIDVASNLSPWFHFGQISVQRSILCVNKLKHKYSESVAGFCEEAIVRRELSDNFCYYNENYDSLKGLTGWAAKTLEDHRKDKREYLYSRDEFENSRTHDDLWNSAQNQLVKEGKMHGFLRMYWAKKILEWTESPEEALEFAIYLNDRFSLDGRDPNGYVGCMWSIGGVHDNAWAERSIFGKIRFMNYQGCKRKFDVKAYVIKYRGKAYPYNKKTEK